VGGNSRQAPSFASRFASCVAVPPLLTLAKIMNITAPLLEIIFALFLMLMPEGTKSFTISSPEIGSTPITWTLQEDGSWSGLSKDSQTAFGHWTSKDMKVTKIQKLRTPENVVDLSQWLTKDDSGYLIERNRIKIGKTEEGSWLFSTVGEPFSVPVRIELQK